MKKTDSIFDLSYVIYEPKILELHPLHQSDVNHVLIQLLRTDGNPPDPARFFISYKSGKIHNSFFKTARNNSGSFLVQWHVTVILWFSLTCFLSLE